MLCYLCADLRFALKLKPKFWLIQAGKGYSVNFPMKDGMNDEAYYAVFRPVIKKIMERFAPDAIVLQCGADSLCGDKLGCFNLTLNGHAVR